MSDELIRKWVETWELTGKALETIKRLELEAMTDADTRAYVHALLAEWHPTDVKVILNSGLVEQQRWFSKAHRRL